MKRLTEVAILLVVAGCAPGDRPVSPSMARGIDAVFADLDRPGSPGASVAVIRDGEMIFSRGYGTAQLEHGIPVTPATVFHVASVSKQFTAMAVNLLAADGALSLDDPVQTHLDYVPDLGAPVTVRQMIHHTSGIRDQWELLAMSGWRLDDVITTEQIRGLMARQQELNFAPNSEYLYSNMGYTLLAETVASVSGMSFPEFTATRIFRPLGMDRTHFHDDHEHVVPGRAYSYAPSEEGYTKSVLSYANAGATSLFTTAEDLARWLDNFRHESVGGPGVMATMKTRGVLTSGDTIGYAHGLSIGEYRGLRTIGHGGADAGFRTQVVWFPDRTTGVVVLTNLASGNPGARALRVADVVLDGEFTTAPETEDETEAHAPELRPASAEAVERAPGRYRTSVGPIVSIQAAEGNLSVAVAQEPPRPLSAIGERSFFATDLGIELHFDGSWDHITLRSPEGEDVGTGDRLPDLPAAADFADFVGTYYSPELDALYHADSAGGSLTLRHIRHGSIVLEPLFPDEFVSDRWYLSTIRFERDTGGAVVGFRATGGRVRNLRFVKLDQPLPS